MNVRTKHDYQVDVWDKNRLVTVILADGGDEVMIWIDKPIDPPDKTKGHARINFNVKTGRLSVNTFSKQSLDIKV